MIICGHFPDNVQTFTEEDLDTMQLIRCAVVAGQVMFQLVLTTFRILLELFEVAGADEVPADEDLDRLSEPS